jgi:hypothetical protein
MIPAGCRRTRARPKEWTPCGVHPDERLLRVSQWGMIPEPDAALEVA